MWAVIEALDTPDGWLTAGLDPRTVAYEWVNAGLSPSEAAAWISAGAFRPHVAAELRAAGITPEQGAWDRPSARAQRRWNGSTFVGSSFAYLVCAGAMTVEQATCEIAEMRGIIRPLPRTRDSRPTSPIPKL
jgi:hypothetical protein